MKEVLMKALLVGIGGFAGANARYWLGGWVSNRWGAAFPYATFVINVSGSFVLGLFMAMVTGRFIVHPNWRLIFAIGFVGAYTTFSTFEYETMGLMEVGSLRRALLNAMGSLVAGFIAVWLGARIGQRL
jgi:CrcB protein